MALIKEYRTIIKMSIDSARSLIHNYETPCLWHGYGMLQGRHSVCGCRFEALISEHRKPGYIPRRQLLFHFSILESVLPWPSTRC